MFLLWHLEEGRPLRSAMGPADTSLTFPRCSQDTCYLGAARLKPLLCKVVTF